MNVQWMALVAIGILVAGGLILALIRPGLRFPWKRGRGRMHRVLVEDALKHIHDCEQKQIACTTEGIAGVLVISTDEAAALLTRLTSMGLVVTHTGGVRLTPEGNAYALRIIRVHRLWERYLADETGVPPTKWHSSAELAEHKLTQAEAEALAAAIGNPHFDPHGDPIPAPDGTMPGIRGRSLLSFAAGEFGVITHIEDEPEAVYAQLAAKGLYVGMQVRMIERTNDRVRFAADGEEMTLPPLLTNNITVAQIAGDEHRIAAPPDTLSSLGIGEEGKVLGISKAMRGQQRRRLLDLGIVPGTTIRAEMQSASGDPVAYNIRGATIALRKNHTRMIFIER